MTSEGTYGERDMGSIHILNEAGEPIAVARMTAAKRPQGQEGWQGHLTAVAPPTVVEDLKGVFTIRLEDGTVRRVTVEEQMMESQISPGVDIAVLGAEEPWF